MSENHTYVDSSEILAKESELNQLKTGNTVEIRNAEQKVQNRISQMKSSGAKLKKELSAERRQFLDKVYNAMDKLTESASIAGENAVILQHNVSALNEAITEASKNVGHMVDTIKANADTAQGLYVHMVEQFALTEARVEYKRFAADEMASIKTRINQLSNYEVNSAAMQMMATTVISDICRMDLSVARQQSVFNARLVEASSLAENIIAQLNSAKSENFAEIGNAGTELLDINYWSSNRFGDLMTEVKELRDKLTLGLEDSTYNDVDVKKDLARLQELNKAKDIVIADARKTYNQSVMRENQALTAMDILQEEHDFSLIGSGFECNDRREAYILRMKRHTDEAEIEVIVSPTTKDTEFSMYFRLDRKAYADQNVLEAITASLAEDFKAAGLRIDVNPHCTAESLQPFNVENPIIPNAARRLHNIPASKAQ